MQRTLSFIAGAVCGAAFGAVTALLLAPAPGRELRARSRARAEQIAAEVRRAYEDRQAELKIQLERLKASRPRAVE